ncbi:hypothetical protein PIIN_10285, partial [Serendipita indica DSM 11827]
EPGFTCKNHVNDTGSESKHCLSVSSLARACSHPMMQILDPYGGRATVSVKRMFRWCWPYTQPCAKLRLEDHAKIRKISAFYFYLYSIQKRILKCLMTSTGAAGNKYGAYPSSSCSQKALEEDQSIAKRSDNSKINVCSQNGDKRAELDTH